MSGFYKFSLGTKARGSRSLRIDMNINERKPTSTKIRKIESVKSILLVEYLRSMVGCVAQFVERRSLAGELTLSYARPAADGRPLCG